VQPLRYRAFAALRCPFCRAEFAIAGRALRCPGRHSFDLARSGYVNFAVGRRQPRAGSGDTRAQLQRRAAVLDAGLFDFVADAIVAGANALPAPLPVVLDAGCGTGHHLARVVGGLGRPSCGLGLDISRDATEMAARRFAALAFAVADVWSDWPIRDGVADLVLSLFAPKNFGEAARCLRPGGLIALAYPGPDHLVELRATLPLLDVPAGKARHYRERLQPLFEVVSHTQVRRRIEVDASLARDLVLMGPNARHLSGRDLAVPDGSLSVTLDVELILARKVQLPLTAVCTRRR
jgi:23S rRNA (guanine745-N1)-methyltransferase